LVAALTVVLAACGGGGGGGHDKAAPPTSSSARPNVASTMRAQVTAPEAHVYSERSTTAPVKTYPRLWLLNGAPTQPIPQTFLVDERRPDGWIKVFLPDRPNGSTGWIQSSELILTPNPYRLRVALRDRQIAVFNGDQAIYTGPVAIGAPATPTPTGRYYVRVLLRSPDPSSVYGPFAYGLSGHSEVLQEFDGGDAELGVHGNNDDSVLGKDVTHGCVRMDNAEITQLSGQLPLGTPVDIVA
jgi:lipoprotein-anchoring transpeptidase ErfK/SrfK